MFKEKFVVSRKTIVGIISIAVVIAAAAGYFVTSAKTEVATYNMDNDNVAIHGYDTVAYFTVGQATKGDANFEHVWEDARWHFASAANRDLFTANPGRYAPQFGGYCALGLSSGEHADADPEAWTIVEGKLYLKKSKKWRDVWRKAPKALIFNGEYNWNVNRKQLRVNL